MVLATVVAFVGNTLMSVAFATTGTSRAEHIIIRRSQNHRKGFFVDGSDICGLGGFIESAKDISLKTPAKSFNFSKDVNLKVNVPFLFFR